MTANNRLAVLSTLIEYVTGTSCGCEVQRDHAGITFADAVRGRERGRQVRGRAQPDSARLGDRWQTWPANGVDRGSFGDDQ